MRYSADNTPETNKKVVFLFFSLLWHNSHCQKRQNITLAAQKDPQEDCHFHRSNLTRRNLAESEQWVELMATLEWLQVAALRHKIHEEWSNVVLLNGYHKLNLERGTTSTLSQATFLSKLFHITCCGFWRFTHDHKEALYASHLVLLFKF